eukprot:m.390154 g.390154  ORF g.390154 m.390154 type:complete len:416 (+) comp20074_c7_seq1:137-1384(+)
MSIKEGWLEKKGDVNTGWKRRWFELRQDELVYRKKQSDVSPAGSIPLIGSTARLCRPQAGRDYWWMEVDCPARTRVFMLRGDKAELEAWVRAILSCCGQAGDPVVGGTQSEQQQPDPVYHSGWLEKQGQRVKNWKRRWFKLRSDRFEYYTSATDAAPKGFIALRGITLSHHTVSPAEATLRLAPQTAVGPADDRIFLCRASQACIEEWVPILNQRIAAAGGTPAAAAAAAASGPAQQPQRQQRQSARQQQAPGQAAQQQQQQQRQGQGNGQGPHHHHQPQQQQYSQSYQDGGGYDGTDQSQRRDIQLNVPQDLAQLQLVEHTDDILDILEQREQPIQQLEQDVTEISEMFRTVHTLVHEQRAGVDTLASHIDEVHGQVEAGLGEIKKADNLVPRWFTKPAKDDRAANGELPPPVT